MGIPRTLHPEDRGNEAVLLWSNQRLPPALLAPSPLSLSSPLPPNSPHVEVVDVDVLVRSCLSLAPQKETFLGRQFWRGRERGERGERGERREEGEGGKRG